MEYLAEEVFRRKAAGETNREIGEHFGLTGKQIKQLATAKAIALILAHPFKIDPYRKFFRNRSVFFGRWVDLSLGDDGS